MSNYIIAGIDPGSTYGIAIVSLAGKKLAAHSAQGGMAEAVRIIERHGTPSLIACDVATAPESALKIASYFSCRLFSPEREIREEEKRQIASGAGMKNNHERDAYAAAVLAYRSHANKMRQIDAIQEVSGEDKERLKHLVLKGYHLKDAFLELREPEEKKEAWNEAPKHPPRATSAEELKERVSSLARENANLRLHTERLEYEKGQLQERLRLLENGVRQSMIRNTELRSLRFRLQKTLERFKPKKKSQMPSPQQKKEENQPMNPSPQPKNDDLNSLGGPKLDLEKMVTDYRRGRKQL